MDAELLEVAEAHVRTIAMRMGLKVMSSEARTELRAAASVARELIARLKALPQPENLDVAELMPSGMALFSLVKGYDKGMDAVLEAIKRHVPELAPLIEELAT